MEVKKDWSKRNHPDRGHKMYTPITEMGLDPELLVYIGRKNGSGFAWIGRYKDLPEKLQDAVIVEAYPRETGYKGLILLTKAVTDGKRYENFWNWDECDKSVPPYESAEMPSIDGVETLFMAVIKDAAQEYRNDLAKAIRENPRKTEKGLRDVVKEVRMLDSQKISILKGTSRGQYILQRLEDEAVARTMCSNWNDLDYPERQEYLEKEARRMMTERVKQKEGSLYARIKRRSVKH